MRWPVFISNYAYSNEEGLLCAMDQKRWQQIESILDKAFTIDDPEKRKVFIKSACGDNNQLYMQVKQMLTSIKKARQNGFLES